MGGTPVASHFFGTTNGTKRSSLSGTFTAPATGLYLLEIENTRKITSSTCLYNYIDNISLVPSEPNFEVNRINIPARTGVTARFTLKGGRAWAEKEYLILFNGTGTFPGTVLGGQNIPLNWDPLLHSALSNPGLPGSIGFMGRLDASGKGAASLTIPPGLELLTGLRINFAYIVCSPGYGLPLVFTSHPVHMKFI